MSITYLGPACAWGRVGLDVHEFVIAETGGAGLDHAFVIIPGVYIGPGP